MNYIKKNTIRLLINNTIDGFMSAYAVLNIVKCHRESQQFISIDMFLQEALREGIHIKHFDEMPDKINDCDIACVGDRACDAVKCAIVLVIQISETELMQNDVFTFRFIPIIMESLLDSDSDRIEIKGGQNVQSIQSYLCGGHIIGTKYIIKRFNDLYFPQYYSISLERIPLIVVTEETYNILRRPLKLGNLSESVNRTCIVPNNSQNIEMLLRQIVKKNLFEFYARISTFKYYEDENGNPIEEFYEKLGSIPTLALLLFCIHRENWKSSVEGWIQSPVTVEEYRKNNESIKLYLQLAYDEIEIILDYCDGLLQAIENVVSHTEYQYGVLSIKRYDFNTGANKEKDRKLLNGEFEFTDQNASGYWRINLLDYSHIAILDNFRDKIKDNQLGLQDIFEYWECPRESYLHNYLNKNENFLHHYGLQLFSDSINMARGYFSVSSRSSAVQDSYELIDYIAPRNCDGKRPFIPGTEYDILLPQNHKQNRYSHPPYTPARYETIHKNINYDIARFFNRNGRFDEIVRNTQKELGEESFQLIKEATIDRCINEIYELIISNHREDDTIIIYYDSVLFSRLELVAKILIGVAIKLANGTDFIVFIPKKVYNVIRFVRQFSCFYNRNGVCEKLHNSFFYFISVGENAIDEALLGESIELSQYMQMTEVNYCCNIGEKTKDYINHILDRFCQAKQKTKTEIIPNFFDLAEIDVDGVAAPIFVHKLKMLLQADIHNTTTGEDKNSRAHGCKITDAHIRLTGVHLDTFYEAQSIFTNHYWVVNIACYLKSKIDLILKENKHISHIVLYGYETYSEALLFELKEQFSNFNLDYMIYEAPKVIKPGIVTPKKIQRDETLKVDKNTAIIYIVGINATLKTFYDMNQEWQKETATCGNTSSQYAFSVISVVPNDKSNCNNVITLSRSNKTLFSEKGYLQFLDEKSEKQFVQYIVTMASGWYDPYNCPLCHPNNIIEERFLTETDETSTVPVQRIKLRNEVSPLPQCESFVGNIGVLRTSDIDQTNQYYNFLYYGHIHRAENHFQYYIRTAHLIHSLYADKKHIDKDFKDWLLSCKSEIDIKAKNGCIDIIVAPAHFSNSTFVNVINNMVFDGRAHIISFNPLKELRSNFEAQYYYYKEIKPIVDSYNGQKGNVEKLFIYCHYVDDQIISGRTFHRTKNLVQNLFNQYGDDGYVQIFSNIFTLIDQHSINSIREYINDESKFHTFIKLYMPSLRSHGDSCPLCLDQFKAKQLSDFEMYEDSKQEYESAIKSYSIMWGMQRHWREKYEYHKLGTITDAKRKNSEISIEKKEKIKIRNWFRFVCEHKLWKVLKENESIDVQKMKEEIYTLFDEVVKLKKIDSKLVQIFGSIYEVKIEYIISYFKVMSRSIAIYGEYTRNAVLSILLEIYDSLCKYIRLDQTINYESCSNNAVITGIIQTLFQIPRTRYGNDLATRQIDFLRIIVARLCSLGSSYFIGEERIRNCRNIAKQLQNIDDIYDLEFDTFLWYNLKKLVYFSKDMDVKGKLLSSICAENSLDTFWTNVFLEMPNSQDDKIDGSDDLNNLIITINNESSKIYNSICKQIKNVLGAESLYFYVFDSNSILEVFNGQASAYVSQELLCEHLNESVQLEKYGSCFVNNNKGIIIKFGDFEKTNKTQKKNTIGELNKVLPVYMRIDFREPMKWENIEKLRTILWNITPDFQRIIARDFNNQVLALHNTQEYFLNMLVNKKAATHNSEESFEHLNEIIEFILKNMHIGDENKIAKSISLYGDLIVSFVFRCLAKVGYYQFCLKHKFSDDNTAYEISKATKFIEDNNMISVGKSESYHESSKNLSYMFHLLTKYGLDGINIQYKDNFKTDYVQSIALGGKNICYFLPLVSTLLNNIKRHGDKEAYMFILPVCESELQKRKQIIGYDCVGNTGECFPLITQSYDIILCNRKKTYNYNSNDDFHISHKALEWLLNKRNLFVFDEMVNGETNYRFQLDNKIWLRYERKKDQILNKFSLNEFKKLLKCQYDYEFSVDPSNDNDDYYCVILKHIAW